MSKIAWWDWEDSVIEDRMPDFRLDFSDFIRKYGN
jgi:hypothetical protein